MNSRCPTLASRLHGVRDVSGGSDSKEFACCAGDLSSIPRLGRSPGKRNGTHSSILAWRIPWTEETGRQSMGLQSMGSQRVRHDWVTVALGASLVTQMVNNLPAMQKTRVQSLGQEDALEKEMTTHSSILACRIPWTEEPGGLQSVGSQRVWHDWATNTSHTILFKTHFYLYSLATPGLSCPEIQVPDISNFFCQQIRPLSCHQKNFAPQIAWIQPDKIPESFTLPSG